MPKTKAHKAEEAMQRKRERFAINFQRYIELQPGTESYARLVSTIGQTYADNRAKETLATFKRYCKEAQIDAHGNPL